MKRFPDYKYRPRRRKPSKKSNMNRNSPVQQEHSSNLIYDRASNCSPHYPRFPRSNSFSYNDCSTRQSETDFRSSSAPVPVFSRLSVSPESNPPSSPEEATSATSAIRDNRSYYYQHQSSGALQQSANIAPEQSFRFAATTNVGLVSQIPTPKPVKLDFNANHWGSIYKPFQLEGSQLSCAPAQSLHLSMSQNFSYSVSNERCIEPEGVDLDVSDVNPEDMEIYICPDRQGLEPNRTPLDLNRKAKESDNEINGGVECDKKFQMPEGNKFMMPENDLTYKGSNKSCSVPAIIQDIENCRDIPSVCYEYDPQPLINALTHKTG